MITKVRNFLIDDSEVEIFNIKMKLLNISIAMDDLYMIFGKHPLSIFFLNFY